MLRKYGLPLDTNREILHRVLASMGAPAGGEAAHAAPAAAHHHAPPPLPEPRASPAAPVARRAPSPRRAARAQSPEPSRGARASSESGHSGSGPAHAAPPAAQRAPPAASFDAQARIDELQSQLARRTAQLRNAEVRPSFSAARALHLTLCRRVTQAALGERELRQGSGPPGGSDAGGPASAHGGHHPGRSRSPVMSGFKLAEVRAHAACHVIM